MKITKVILLLFVFLCTSNLWGQLNKDWPQNLITENRVIKNMKTIVYGLWSRNIAVDWSEFN